MSKKIEPKDPAGKVGSGGILRRIARAARRRVGRFLAYSDRELKESVVAVSWN